MVQLGEELVVPPYAENNQANEDEYQQRRHGNISGIAIEDRILIVDAIVVFLFTSW